MKKLITVILILAMLLPAAALAEDPDPIVGSWYIMLDIKGSILEQAFPEDALRFISIMTFTEDGKILYGEQDYYGSGKIDAPQPAIYGKWEKNGSKYGISILAKGTDQAFIEDGLLYVAAFNEGIYFGYRKMEALDLYDEVYRK